MRAPLERDMRGVDARLTRGDVTIIVALRRPILGSGGEVEDLGPRREAAAAPDRRLVGESCGPSRGRAHRAGRLPDGNSHLLTLADGRDPGAGCLLVL